MITYASVRPGDLWLPQPSGDGCGWSHLIVSARFAEAKEGHRIITGAMLVSEPPRVVMVTFSMFVDDPCDDRSCSAHEARP